MTLPARQSSDAAAALLLCSMMLLSIAAIAIPALASVAGVLALLAAGLLISRVTRAQRAVILALTVAGLGVLTWGALRGGDPDWLRIFTLNQGLLSMLAAVSFLQLVAAPAELGRSEPGGRRAIVRTAAMIHGLGAVINISALTLIGQRLSRTGRLGWPDAVLLSRAYSCAAFWSPFWGATAVALTYAPRAKVAVLVPLGMLLALCALTMSLRTIIQVLGPDADTYEGFPATRDVLWVPSVLVVVVMVVHAVLPSVPTTGIITTSSLALTVVVLIVRRRGAAFGLLNRHARTRLAEMGGELSLFVSAGVLAVGIATAVEAAPPNLPMSHLTAWGAWFLLLTMVTVSAIGIHPAISVAAAAALLAPIEPDPTLFALTGVIAWGCIAAAGPLSGLNIVLHAQFGVDNLRMAGRNLPYLMAILLVALPLLHLCAAMA